MQISAILSDYDGTLFPTASIRNKENITPEELENTLGYLREFQFSTLIKRWAS
jgi:hypothetical protein